MTGFIGQVNGSSPGQPPIAMSVDEAGGDVNCVIMWLYLRFGRDKLI